MTLLAILLGTLAAGIGSVWLAAWLSFGIVSRYTQHMLSLAAGALLATAFLHLLPEAFEAGVEPHNLFVTLLFGLLFFFLLDKAELWHHGHEHQARGGGDQTIFNGGHPGLVVPEVTNGVDEICSHELPLERVDGGWLLYEVSRCQRVQQPPCQHSASCTDTDATLNRWPSHHRLTAHVWRSFLNLDCRCVSTNVVC